MSSKNNFSFEASDSKDKKKEIFFLVFIFLFSFALRLIYLLQIRTNPHFSTLSLDPLYHDVWAQTIAQGDWIGNSVFFRAPFYPYFLAIIYRIFGHNYFIPRLIQHLIGSFSCILIYFLAKKIYNKNVAIISSLITATYGMLISFEAELLLDFFLVFFDTLLILLLLKAKDSPKRSLWFICGIVLGFSAITRPNILFCIPFIWLWTFVSFLKEFKLKKVLSFCITFFLGAVIIIFPVTLRNYLVGKDFVMIASQGGINFYIGNNENADGMSAIFYKPDWQYRDFEYLAQKEAGKTLKPSEISDFYYKKGVEFIRKYPSKALKLTLKKLYLFWNKFEVSNNQDIYFFRRYSSLIRILPFGFWLVGPLALTGIALSLIERRKIFLPLIFILSYMVTVVMFFVTARFRLPVIPFLIIFASFPLYWVIKKIIQGEYCSLLTFLVLFIPSVLLVDSNIYHLNSKNFAQAYFSLGNVYLKKGDTKKALEQYNLALKDYPQIDRIHLNKGIIFFRLREWDKAEKEFLIELEINPQNEKAYNNLSVLYRLENDNPRAVIYANKALEIKPYYKEAYINSALAYQNSGDLEKAKEILSLGLAQIPDFFEANFVLANIYQKEEIIDLAIQEYQKITQQKPQRGIGRTYDLETLFLRDDPITSGEENIQALAHYNLGVIYAKENKLSEAKENFEKAIQIKPDFADAYANLGKVYDLLKEYLSAEENLKKAIQIKPEEPASHFNLGLVYGKQGNVEDAIREFRKSLEIKPDFAEAKEKLRLADSLLDLKRKGR
jgi:tetratricopeptide (TPR) repeat protein